MVVVNIPNPTGRSADNLSLSRYQSFSVLDNRDLSFSKSVNLKWERAVQGPNWVPIPWKIGIPFWSLSPWSEVPWWIGSSAVTSRCLNYNISEQKKTKAMVFLLSVQRNAHRTKNGIMWGKFPSGGPPPLVWETPCYQKKVGFIFHFRTTGTSLVFTKKSPFWVIDWNYVVGIGEPPLRDARFLHFPQKENIVKC